MKKQAVIFFILITIIGMVFSSCDSMATLFHGEKPEDPPVIYTVTFNANGANGTLPSTQTVNAGTVISLPDKGDLSKGDDIFAGWNESAGGTGTTYSIGASVTVTRNMAFYAQWLDSSTPQYTVTFSANGATSGAAPAPQTVYRGISITVPGQGTLVYSEKTFGGWNTQANGGGTSYAVGAAYTVNGNITLYARWQSKNQYTVTYHANGASGAVPTAQTVDAPGAEITVQGAGDMVYSGKKFTGWSTNAGGTGFFYPAGVILLVTGNITLYAQWASSYTITFNANGASGAVPTAQTVEPGAETTLPGAGDMAYTGKKFTGWCINAGGTGTLYPAGAAYTANGNITLYAQWQNLYTITFSVNGASGAAPDAQTVDPGTVITLPGEGTMIYAGRMFDGWNTQANGGGTSYAEGAPYTVNATISLYAKWVNLPIETPGATLADKLTWLETNAASNNTYIITLNYDEGIGPKTLSYSGKSNITLRIKNTVMRTVTLSSDGTLFTVGSGVTLILDSNITLKGRNNSNNSNNIYGLVRVNSNGTLIMNAGTKITGNTNKSSSYYYYAYGGGVSVIGGTFTMNGGEISGNTASNSYNSTDSNCAYGGGVYVDGGTFTMNDGKISGNTASAFSASSNYKYGGGGVYVNSGTFTMNSGEISGNTASSSYSGSSTVYIYGGGVYVNQGRFTKNGGTIYGSNGDVTSNTVENSSGTLLNNRGHAVYVGSSTPAKKMENTVEPGVYLFFNYNSGNPVWSGGWE